MCEVEIVPMDVKRFRRLACAIQVNYRTETNWLAVKSESRIGAVVYDRFDDDWSFVVLARGVDGLYGLFDMGVDHKSEADAHQACVASLLQEGRTSPAPFPSAGQIAPKI